MKTLAAVILIVAAAFLWTDRIQVHVATNGVVTYDTWTGRLCVPTTQEIKCLAEITK